MACASIAASNSPMSRMSGLGGLDGPAADPPPLLIDGTLPKAEVP